MRRTVTNTSLRVLSTPSRVERALVDANYFPSGEDKEVEANYSSLSVSLANANGYYFFKFKNSLVNYNVYIKLFLKEKIGSRKWMLKNGILFQNFTKQIIRQKLLK